MGCTAPAGIEASRVLSPVQPPLDVQKNKLIPGLESALILFRSLAHRGRRRSRRRMTEQGGCADNAHPVEPREAQRPTSLAARTPQAATPGNGDIAVGAQAGLASPSQGSRSAAPGRLPALHPLPFGRADGKQGYGQTRPPENQEPGQRSVGCLTIESDSRGAAGGPMQKARPRGRALGTQRYATYFAGVALPR